ncbi:MAG: hypothetical protein E6G39_13030 [Actinobacteria bacterium]|nr:MAG: hypothetical protein E6G39_13030 [Actinomycetota bacterium]
MRIGGVLSTTVMCWTHMDVWPAEFVADQVRRITPVALQPESPLRSSSKVTTGFASQVSVAVAVPVLGGSRS